MMQEKEDSRPVPRATKHRILVVIWTIATLAITVMICMSPNHHRLFFRHDAPTTTHVELRVPLPYAQWLPDPVKTPGAVFPNVTAEQVSVPGYARSVRNVSEKEKEEVFREYGITHHDPGEYEIDHLVSLELSGSNDISNLWPQPYHGLWNAHVKDKLENKLHYMVAHKEISLSEAVYEIRTDWIAAYKKHVAPNP